MEYTDMDKGMTPEEIKRQKRREWQREYRRKHPERVRAQCRAWREKNPEKNKESQQKSCRKYYLAHREELQASGRAAARKYYAEHREEVLARQKIYKSKNRDKIAERRRSMSADAKQRQCEYQKRWREQNPEKVREFARKYAREHRAGIAEKWKANAAATSIRRKEQYRQNSEPARNRAAIYYARAMASRQMAPGVCPAFRFVLELKATKNIGYKLCGGAKYSFVQRAVNGCPALSAANANLCPMVANPEIQQKQMLAACTMPDVFKIPLAWPAIRAHAMALRMQSEK